MNKNKETRALMIMLCKSPWTCLDHEINRVRAGKEVKQEDLDKIDHVHDQEGKEALIPIGFDLRTLEVFKPKVSND